MPYVVDGGPGPPKPPIPTPKPTPAPKPAGPVGAQPSLVTASGGLFGTNNILLYPFYSLATNQSYMYQFDPTNFNTEVDCVYNFRLEDVKVGRNIDVHKVYIKYRDLGPVMFYASVTAVLYNKATKEEQVQIKTVPVKLTGKGDYKLHTYFIDLKVVGENPQLKFVRKANQGPLSIIRAMLIGNSSEDEQL